MTAALTQRPNLPYDMKIPVDCCGRIAIELWRMDLEAEPYAAVDVGVGLTLHLAGFNADFTPAQLRQFIGELSAAAAQLDPEQTSDREGVLR